LVKSINGLFGTVSLRPLRLCGENPIFYKNASKQKKAGVSQILPLVLNNDIRVYS